MIILIILRYYQLSNVNLLIKEEKIFTLKKGTGRIALINQLRNENIIDYPIFLRYLLILNTKSFYLKAGTYYFKPGMNILDIFHLLTSGKEVQFPLRFIEGMKLSDYLYQLRKVPHIKHTLRDDNYSTVAKALNIDNLNNLEGWFCPDTWMYTFGTTDIDMLKRAHLKMIKIVEKYWNYRALNLPYKDKNQFVTMASIIEKETAVVKERSKIASVLINRLKIGMRLQTDPTVIYGMGINYQGNISKKDIKTYTAYNTYRINGLPPGPISIPSQSSLYAAAHPDKTSYIYFVSDGNGRHIFNYDFASHKKSVQKYIKLNKRKL